MGIVEATYAEIKQQELKKNPYSCLSTADIDVNPHQVEAFTFSLAAMKLGGAILADEVGLGKTIEAGLVLKYLLNSGSQKILLVMPSNLRKQWQVELDEKFEVESIIVESGNWDEYKSYVKNESAVVIVSYNFASRRKSEFTKVPWSFCIFDEAHRLRNVYKNGSKMASNLYELTEGIPKLMLTARFKKPSSIGVSFYLSEETNKINVDVYWGSYYSDKVDDGEVVDESIEEDYENKKKKKRQVYVREQMAETVELNLDDIGRAKTIPLHSNAHIFIYVIQMRLDNGYKMLSVYLHNNNKGGDEKEYERVMFQVELHVSTKDKEAVFIPEYICRKQELEDEYYYKGRPIFGRGRGCAATWNKREDEENAYSIDSTFIPDHEIPGVSAQVKDVPEKAFSMLQLGSPKKKEVSIANLRLLTALYGDWIKNELKENPQMQESSFQATGKSIIEKCLDSLRRMNEGIDLIEKDENAFKAFTFMNQSMYLQRSITAYSKDCGRGIPCSLSDYMKDNKEKGIEQDHSEWRPFQIAFILLNIKGLIDPESDERNIVDLLYFPTGGGKTEAYLGLIAFIIAYRRLTSDSDYEKDGGVTVFLRYTLRLLTTQQRDRLLKLIVAMEDLRERSEKNGKAEFGTTPISIGYWVGGSVTPNKFDEYEKDEYSRKEFVRKVTKQIIRCPYCGKLIGRENYDINTKTNSVKITCSYDKCKFSKSSGKSIPVYLVDEEIYAKCPTVVISTVDKFAKLPWSEQAGLLFGRTDRFCPRHGYQAVGYEKELVGKRHNKDTKNGLDACVIEACKPFYPPQLIIQDELHLISGPLGTIYGGYETIIEDMCCLEKNGKKIHPKYVVSTATIKNAGEQIKCLYARENYAQFPPSGFDTRDSYFIREVL